MRNPIEIDYSHSRAIIREIGERLRTSLKDDPRVTGQPQIANRPPPSVRGPVAAKRREADDAVVGTPPTGLKLRLREGRTAIAKLRCSVDGTTLELRSSSPIRSERILPSRIMY